MSLSADSGLYNEALSKLMVQAPPFLVSDEPPWAYAATACEKRTASVQAPDALPLSRRTDDAVVVSYSVTSQDLLIMSFPALRSFRAPQYFFSSASKVFPLAFLVL